MENNAQTFNPAQLALHRLNKLRASLETIKAEVQEIEDLCDQLDDHLRENLTQEEHWAVEFGSRSPDQKK